MRRSDSTRRSSKAPKHQGEPGILSHTSTRQGKGGSTIEFLARRAEMLRLFIEHAPVAIAMFDRDMRYLAASRCWMNDYRLGERSVLGRSHYEVFPEIEERWKNVHRRGMAGEVVRADEDRFERADGTAHWLRWEVRPWFTEDGPVGGIVIYSEDITKRKEAELALEKEREVFRHLTHIASDYFWEVDKQFRLTEASSAGTERTALNLHSYIGKLLWQIPFAGLTETDWGSRRALLEAHKPFRNFEARLPDRRGAVRWFVISGDPVFSCTRQFAGYRGVARDITERKLVEERLRWQAMVFKTAQEGIAITDPQGRIIDVNPAFERITEYALGEIRGKNMRFIQSGRHDAEFYAKMWKSVLETGSWQGEIWNRRKGGEIFLEWISINAVHDERGNLVAYVSSSVDLNRMQHAQSELERLAHHDPLTNLPNRLLLTSRLEHAIARVKRDGGTGAVLFVDLDHFKAVNDTLGHKAGDELLIAVANRLRARLRQIDTLARLGGDEFVIVLEGLPDGAAAKVAQEVIQQLLLPFHLADGKIASIGCSVGIALFPKDGELAQELMDRADSALYDAKAAGQGVHRFFTGPSMAIQPH